MAELNWNQLGFGYRKTNTMVSSYFKDGKWSEVKSSTDDNLTINAFAGVFHYSIECFEGLKAYRGVDGKIRLFRPEENAKRLRRSAEFLGIAAPSEEQFIDMCIQAALENEEFIPPYGNMASLYLRPTLIGYNATLGVKSADECLFMVLCAPVGTYSGNLLEPVNSVICRNYDRAATYGTGSYKIGANYAISIFSYNKARSLGYKSALYLDPATHSKIDEFAAANFFGIKNNTFVTPSSNSVLPSITNKSLMELAPSLGIKVEKRDILVEELSTFEEVGECGTAVCITPISYIEDRDSLEGEVKTRYTFASETECGPVSLKLYNTLTGIQFGEIEDKFGWCIVIK